MTKVLTVRVSPNLLSRVDARAASYGLDRTQYVRQVLEADLAAGGGGAQGKFRSEDLAGRFRLGGKSATNRRTRQQLRLRAGARREANC